MEILERVRLLGRGLRLGELCVGGVLLDHFVGCAADDEDLGLILLLIELGGIRAVEAAEALVLSILKAS